MFLAEFFFCNSLPGNRFQLSFHRLFCYLGRFPPNPMILSTIYSNPLRDRWTRSWNPQRVLESLRQLGFSNMFLGKIFPSPIFVAFRFCFPQKCHEVSGFGCFFIRVWKKNPRYSLLKDQNGRDRKREKENRVRQQGTFQRFRPFTFFDMPGNIENWTLQKNSKIDLSFTKKSINPWNWIGWFWFTLCLVLNQHQPWLQLLKFTLPETNTSRLKVGHPQEECLLFSYHWFSGVNSLFFSERVSQKHLH